MIAPAKTETGSPQTLGYDDDVLDRQRSTGSLLSFLLFPLIATAAIAVVALELVR